MQSETVSSTNDPVIEGLISITSISSPSSSSSSSSSSSDGSFDLFVEKNHTKIDDKKGTTLKLEKESFSSQNHEQESSIQWAPPVQTMGRSNYVPGYDPNRIPSAIFASKPTSAVDWSVASNESLFSIHMGNNSFSGDIAILMGKSGELYNFDDLIGVAPSQQTKPYEVINAHCNLPTVIETTSEVENSRQSLSIEEKSSTEKEVDTITKTEMVMKSEDNNQKANLSSSNNSLNISDGRETPTRDSTRTCASNQNHSDESETNTSSSFAFPVLMSLAGNNVPVTSTYENVLPRHVEEPKIELHENVHPIHVEEPKIEPQAETHRPAPADAFGSSWFNWFRVPTCTFSLPRCTFCC